MIYFWGKVRHGDARGKSLGYPTANMALHKKIEEGVYVSFVGIDVENTNLPALTFVGPAKTFGKTKYQAETYLLDFHKNLYGRYITIRLLKKLRGNKKFASIEELISQMKKDELAARQYFKSTSL